MQDAFPIPALNEAPAANAVASAEERRRLCDQDGASYLGEVLYHVGRPVVENSFALNSRLVFPLAGLGFIHGPKLTGVIHDEGADLDAVRMYFDAGAEAHWCIVTDDCALIHVVCRGAMIVSQAQARQCMAGIIPSDLDLWSELRFTSDDLEYRWLNERSAVGCGRPLGNGLVLQYQWHLRPASDVVDEERNVVCRRLAG
ncbi:MAG: DUF3237 family protein [Opitutae bacterium]|nr:DUF3237 family protein [Opitutae bacterium]